MQESRFEFLECMMFCLEQGNENLTRPILELTKCKTKANTYWLTLLTCEGL